MVIVRTTLTINDDLLARAKVRAKKNGVSLGAYVDDALRQYLSQRDEAPQQVDLPVAQGGRLRRGIDPASNRDLYAALDESTYYRA